MDRNIGIQKDRSDCRFLKNIEKDRKDNTMYFQLNPKDSK